MRVMRANPPRPARATGYAGWASGSNPPRVFLADCGPARTTRPALPPLILYYLFIHELTILT